MNKSSFKIFVFGILAANSFLFAGRALADGTTDNIKSLQDYIDNVSQKISQLTVGSSVTEPFKKELQDVQSMETQAVNLQNLDSAKAQSEIDVAQRKLKKLDQLVDLTSGAQGDMNGDDAIELQSIRQKINEVEVEINKIVVNGGDTTALKSVLQEIKGIVTSAQEKINAHNMPAANILIKKAQDRLDNLNDSIDGALDIAYDGSRKIIRDYNNSISGVSQDLNSLATIDPEIGSQVEAIAKSQDDSVDNVDALVSSIAARQGFVKFLIGANTSSIEKLLLQIDGNKKNIEKLKTIQSQITDQAVSVVLQNQIQILQQQTASLEAYIQNNEGGYSLFGWFLKYL